MKFICTKENLRSALNLTTKVVAKNPSLPVLSNILISVDDGILQIKATDLEIGVIAYVSGKMEESGKIALPGSILAEYIQYLPEDQVVIWAEGNKGFIKSGDFEAQLSTQDSEEFPLIPRVKNPKSFKINCLDLHTILEKVNISSAIDVLRPEISAILWKTNGNQCSFISTDSFRLTEIVLNCKGDEFEFLLPIKSSMELSRFCSNLDGDLTVNFDGQQVQIVHDKALFISRVVDGNFPDYKSIIPDKTESALSLDSEEFEQALKSVGLFSQSGASEVEVEFDSNQKILILSSQVDNLGQSQAKLKLLASSGNDQKMIFNTKYLLDGIRILGSKNTTLEFSHAAGPLTLQPSEEQGLKILHLVMPIKHD